MFDLERAVAEWRLQMADGGVSHDEILDELESHLRDELDSQLRSSVDPEAAFAAAVRRVGEACVLKREFAATTTAADRLKDALFTLAGIPNQNLATTMNTSRVEPAWATYLKATAFLVPAMFLATLSAIFVVPKLQQICLDAGLPEATAGAFWNVIHSSIQVILAIGHQGIWIVGATVLTLLLLEWRVAPWPRYRRAAVGCGAFVVNSLVLLAFFIMFLAAIAAAPGLAHAK